MNNDHRAKIRELLEPYSDYYENTLDDLVAKLDAAYLAAVLALPEMQEEVQDWDDGNCFCQKCDFCRTDDSKDCLCVIRNQLRKEITTALTRELGGKQ